MPTGFQGRLRSVSRAGSGRPRPLIVAIIYLLLLSSITQHAAFRPANGRRRRARPRRSCSVTTVPRLTPVSTFYVGRASRGTFQASHYLLYPSVMVRAGPPIEQRVPDARDRQLYLVDEAFDKTAHQSYVRS